VLRLIACSRHSAAKLTSSSCQATINLSFESKMLLSCHGMVPSTTMPFYLLPMYPDHPPPSPPRGGGEGRGEVGHAQSCDGGRLDRAAILVAAKQSSGKRRAVGPGLLRRRCLLAMTSFGRFRLSETRSKRKPAAVDSRKMRREAPHPPALRAQRLRRRRRRRARPRAIRVSPAGSAASG